MRIVLQRGGGWYALNYNTENTNCIVWHLNSAADKDTVITLEPAVSFGGVYRLKLAQRNLYLTVVGSSLKWMAFTNEKDQIFSFVEPGANPGSATGNGLSLRCPVSYSGISTKFVDGGHRGVDYIASKGTPVYAATSGRVIRVYSWQGSTNEAAVDSIGNAVFLEHFDSKGNTCGMTCYYHLREAPTSLISADQYVAEGDLIGYVGNTGKVVAINGDGSHLHFEVKTGTYFNNSTVQELYHSGIWVNPLNYITH